MNIDKQIEFDKVKEMWADLAITDYAKERIGEIKWCFSESELKKQLRDTTDARYMIEIAGTPPLQNITEIKDILSRGKSYQNSLAYYDENLDEISELCDEIRSKIRGCMVDDYASKELEHIRKRVVECDLVFAVMVSYVFFGWTPLQVITCSLTGALAELLFEIVLSPIGYKVTKGWKAEKVGEEYIRSIS